MEKGSIKKVEQKKIEATSLSIVLLVVLLCCAYTAGFLLRADPANKVSKGQNYLLQSYVSHQDIFWKANEQVVASEGDTILFLAMAHSPSTLYFIELNDRGLPVKSFTELVLKVRKLKSTEPVYFKKDVEFFDKKELNYTLLLCAGKETLSPFRLEKSLFKEEACKSQKWTVSKQEL